ncbi:hypothetical protein BBK14_26860 [Parafrankia soli]|uniref:CHK kinase-like domain-containing protein n=1 Tax=Parafrankia soli TaxID=2599596 RepID=A0A1S1PHZ5_9ACTN|nr:phosphotransferase [Parafrankia soli]OHV21350.1 hypothetical protein BBK14_26860 [Parafrankia soli]
MTTDNALTIAGGHALPGGPAPRDETTVLSPEWLTAMLDRPGAVVTGTEVTQRLETVATKVRFRLHYADPQPGVNAPTDLCAKGYFNPAMHGRSSSTEADFYRQLAPVLPVHTPPCLHAAVDSETGHALIIMTDLVEAGATFLDPTVDYSADQAAATLDQLAALHAATWTAAGGGAGTDTAPGVDKAVAATLFPPRLATLAGLMNADYLQGQLDDGRAPDVDDSTRRADRLIAAMHALARVGVDQPRCLVHGDLHTGNVYRLADGSPGLIDWQVVQYGVWALDVSYHLAAVLDPDERGRAERGLLDHYLDRLATRGVTPPPRDDAWCAYRAHLPYGYYLWSITRAVDRPIIEHLTGRLSLAAAQHASLDLLGV